MFESLKNFVKGKSFSGYVRETLGRSDDNWGNDKYLTASKASLYVNKALNKRAEKVGEIDFFLRTRGNRDNIITEHEILDKLAKPNPFHTGEEFWALYQKNKDTFGEAFIWIESGREDPFQREGKIKNMWVLFSPLVEVVIKDGEIIEFIYCKNTESERHFKTEEIMYSFYPDPQKPMRGESLLVSGTRVIDTDIQISDYHARVLKNGGRPDGILKFKSKEKLSKKQRQELESQYEKEYAGAKKAGRPMFLAGETEYQKIGLSPDELDFIETKKMTLNDILILTGVPKSVLASFDDIKYDNARESMRMFLSETIKPLMRQLCNKLNEDVVTDKYELDFVDPTPEDHELKFKKLTTANDVNAMTLNEKRLELGLEEIDGGEEIYAPFNIMPLGTSDRATEKQYKKITSKSETKHPLSDPDVRENYAKVYEKRLSRREELMKRILTRFFREQKKRILEKITPQKSYKFRRKDLIDDVFDQALEAELAKESVLPVIEQMVKDAGSEAMSLVGYDREFQLTVDIQNTLNSRVDFFTNSINETQFNKLKNEFKTSLELGESRDQLADRISDTYDDIDDWKALQIANTEVHVATQLGSFNAYKQSGTDIKIWTSVGDKRVRDSHRSIDGEERPLDIPFSNGLMYPGDPQGPASEVIGCRCTI